MKPLRIFLAVFPGIWLSSALAYGQNADMNTAGPTANDYELRIIEPAPGAAIPGSSVRVEVDTALPRSPGRFTAPTDRMPHPFIRVFLDGQPEAELHGRHNVDTIENVAPGGHTLVFEALNRSGEIIDRRAIRFREVPRTASTGATASDASHSEAGP
jgi:hypothetical protein